MKDLKKFVSKVLLLSIILNIFTTSISLAYDNIDRYSNLIKGLIFAYFVVLLIQQCCVLLGLPIFNVSNYDVTQPWKLNSLMSEPEHSGRMMALLVFSYLTIQDCIVGRKMIFKESWRKDKAIWLAFLWSMLTMVSAGAYLFLFIVLFFHKLVNHICVGKPFAACSSTS